MRVETSNREKKESLQPEKVTFFFNNEVDLTLYYIAFGLYYIAYTFTGSALHFDILWTVLKAAACALLVFKLFFQKYNVKQMAFFVLSLGIAMLSWWFTRDENLIVLALFILAGSSVKIKKLARIAFLAGTISCVVIVFLCLIGQIDDVTMYGASGLRHSLGFSHPNRFGAALLSICCSLAIMRFPTIGFADLAVYLSAAILTGFVAFSRTFVVAILLVAALFFLCSKSYKKGGQRIALGFFMVLFVGFVVASVVFMVIYTPDDPFLLSLNHMLSDRLFYAHDFFSQAQVTPMGFDWQDAQTQGGVYNSASFVDNGYDRLLLYFGVVPFSVFIISYFYLFYWSWKNNVLSPWVIGAFIYAVVGLSEWQFAHFMYNYSLIGLSFLLFRSKNANADAI